MLPCHGSRRTPARPTHLPHPHLPLTLSYVQQEALRRAIEQDPSLLAQHPELQQVAQAAEAEGFKARGNTAFAAGKFEEAVALFTRCIELDGGNHIYHSNRAAAHTGLKDYRAAARDAARCTQLRPQWAKGWSRLGAAHFGLEEFSEVRVGAAGRGIGLGVDCGSVPLLDHRFTAFAARCRHCLARSNLSSQLSLMLLCSHGVPSLAWCAGAGGI